MTTESLFSTVTPEKMRVKRENSNYDDLQTTLRKLVLQSHPFFQTCYPHFPLSSCLVPQRFLKRTLERGNLHSHHKWVLRQVNFQRQKSGNGFP